MSENDDLVDGMMERSGWPVPREKAQDADNPIKIYEFGAILKSVGKDEKSMVSFIGVDGETGATAVEIRIEEMLFLRLLRQHFRQT